jgi:predicted deacylase
MPLMTVGDITSKPGSLQYGRWKALSHPTGHSEFLPVVIAQGKQDGPCLWLTAGIHGPEHAGPAVLYRLLDEELVGRIRGTIVAIPALNPAGLRTMQRQPYHVDEDPNRLWPDGKPRKALDPDREPPSSLEITYQRLYEQIVASADAMIDFHCAWTGSIPFAFRDRLLYREEPGASPSLAEAQALSEKQLELLQAFGHTIVVEMPVEKLLDHDLERSASGSVLYVGRIPAFTVELGSGHMPDAAIVSAAVAGTRNVMRHLGMLDGEMEPIQGIKVIDLGHPVRRCDTPRVKEACVVLHLVEPGDLVKAGDVVAEVRDIWGRPIGDGLLRSEYDGFVIGRSHGIYYYPGAEVLCMAITNDAPLVTPYPQDYFKLKD